MSEQFEFINENLVTRRFHSYLGDMNVQDAFEQIFDDLINEDLSEAETEYVVHEILMPELVILFAEKYDALGSAYDYDHSEDNLNAIFETFCAAEHLSEPLQNLLAATINKHAAAEDDDEEDDNNVVFKPNDWDKLSGDERKAKVKAFLKKIANVHNDARDLKPFLKNLNIGDPENPHRIEKVKTFDRDAHRYSPNESTIRFPDVFYQGHDEDHRSHPLHVIVQKHGFKYSHTTPVTQHDGSVFHHHTWHNSAGHQLGAYAGKTDWSSKKFRQARVMFGRASARSHWISISKAKPSGTNFKLPSPNNFPKHQC